MSGAATPSFYMIFVYDDEVGGYHLWMTLGGWAFVGPCQDMRTVWSRDELERLRNDGVGVVSFGRSADPHRDDQCSGDRGIHWRSRRLRRRGLTTRGRDD